MLKPFIFNTLRNQRLQKTVITVFWIAILLCCIINVLKLGINADSCFYIAVSRLLNEGLIPFIDFNPGYTPLSFYIMQLPQLIVGQDFTILLGILTAIQLLNSFILYKICHKVTHSLNLSQFCAILFMIISLLWSPEYILEPFILLFGFLAMLCWQKREAKYLLLSGFLCFCSFWCKQYGFGFLLLSIVYCLVNDSFSKIAIRNSLFVLVGFLIGAIIFVSILLLQGIPLYKCTTLGGAHYEKDGITGLLEGYIILFKMIPLLVIPVLISVLRIKEVLKNPVVIVAWCGIIGFMLQCYVRLYAHYLVLAVPFCALLFISISKLIKKSDNRTYYKIALVVTLILPLRFLVPSTISLLQSNEKQRQTECSLQISKRIPKGTEAVFASQDMLYVTLLNRYNPPLIAKYGLSNGFVREPAAILDLCHNATYCIIGLKEAENRTRFTEDVNRYLDTAFVKYPCYGIGEELEGYVFVRK